MNKGCLKRENEVFEKGREWVFEKGNIKGVWKRVNTVFEKKRKRVFAKGRI